jgi:hypothetical protein
MIKNWLEIVENRLGNRQKRTWRRCGFFILAVL